jgi:hypothetical protein
VIGHDGERANGARVEPPESLLKSELATPNGETQARRRVTAGGSNEMLGGRERVKRHTSELRVSLFMVDPTGRIGAGAVNISLATRAPLGGREPPQRGERSVRLTAELTCPRRVCRTNTLNKLTDECKRPRYNGAPKARVRCSACWAACDRLIELTVPRRLQL